jgi:hypothetical protein
MAILTGRIPFRLCLGMYATDRDHVTHALCFQNTDRSPSLYSSHTVPKRGSPARILTISALSRVLPVGGQTSLAEANSEIAMVVRQPWSALAAD